MEVKIETTECALAMSATTSLFDAVEEGRLKLVKLILDRDTDVNWQDKAGRTPLMLSILTTYVDVSGAVNNEKMAKCLLSCGADPNRQDSQGKTALIHAVELNRDIVLIQMLLNHGANPSLEDNLGMSPLLYAARSATDPDQLALLVSACKAQGKDVIIITPHPSMLTKNIEAKVVHPDCQSAVNVSSKATAVGDNILLRDLSEVRDTSYMKVTEEPGLEGKHSNDLQSRHQGPSKDIDCHLEEDKSTFTFCPIASRHPRPLSSESKVAHVLSPLASRSKTLKNKWRGPSQGSFDEEQDEEPAGLCSNHCGKDSPTSVASSPCCSPFSGSPRVKKDSTHSLHAIEYATPHRSPLLYNSAKLIKMPPHMRKLIRRNTTDMFPYTNQYPSFECVTDTRQSLESLPQKDHRKVDLNSVRKSLLQWERELLSDSSMTSLSRAGSLPLLDTTGKPQLVKTADAKRKGSQSLFKGDGSFGSGTRLSDVISVTRPGTLPALGTNKGRPLPDIGRAWEPKEESTTETARYSQPLPSIP